MSLKSSQPEVQSESEELELFSAYSENTQLSTVMHSAQGPWLLKQT